MKITLRILFSLLLTATIVYLLGPRPSHPDYSTKKPLIPELGQLEAYVDEVESRHKTRPDNEAEIIWADSAMKRQTDYAVVYLHGYSASKQEGNPVHQYLAKTLNANLYLARLADHGIDTASAMEYMTADRLWESAKQALEIGKRLGKKVIIASTSTGGTLSLKLAATYPEINSLILLSPNIEINDPLAFMLNGPWGLQISRAVMGGKERILDWRPEAYKKYWYMKYRLESLVQLEELLETTMTRETFQAVKQPVLLLYYYKNEKEQDPVVRVDAMLKMYDELGTPANLKSKKAIPDAANHVIGSYITSKDVKSVEKEIKLFVSKISSP